jgi:photosystem II stability/assembly factor-like uncharacterized protein
MSADTRIFLACYDRGITRAAEGADGTWEVRTALPDLAVTCLAADPSNPERAYAGTRASGVWRSKDGGVSWQNAGKPAEEVKSLAVSPHDAKVIYAGTKSALIFRSGDGGTTWQELDGFRRIPNRWWWFSPAEPPDRRPYVIAIAPSPTEPDVLLAGVEFGAVVRSEDGGATWSRHLRGTLRDCHALIFHATDGDWAYQAGGTGGGASFSRDGGRTWQKAKRGLAKNYGIVCAADGQKPEVWYVCVAPSPYNAFGQEPRIYLYRATAGVGWQPIGWTPHPLSEAPTALVAPPGKTGYLYAGLKGGDVWHSRDYGDSWEQLPFNLGGIWHSMLVLNP